MVSAEAAPNLSDDEVVLGIVEGDEARAYPWSYAPHVVNHTVAGRPLAVVLCPQCSSGTAFDRTVESRVLTFEATTPSRGEWARGFIYNGTSAVRDRETGSMWSPFLALAFRGPLKGRTLELVPLWQMEWGAWRELHPHTLVLDPGSATYSRRLTIEHERLDRNFRTTVARWDERLPHNTLVLGVVTAGGQRAYPLEVLRSGEGVVNDDVGGAPIVVLSDPSRSSYGAAAFSRRAGGRVLTFTAASGRAVDRETGSRWTLDGWAVEGPLTGTRLPFVASHVGMWYVWAAHFPDLDIAT